MGFETQYGINIAPAGLAGGQATSYVHNVRKHLSWIDGTKVGRLLLKAIAWHVRNNPGNLAGGVMTIQPYTGADCNATVNNATSTGTGWSQPTVSYSPGVFNHGGACHVQLKKAATNRGLYPDEILFDEILFHELVHGLRGAAARFRGLPVSGGLTRYNGTEEFIAVLTTNICLRPVERLEDRTAAGPHGLHETGAGAVRLHGVLPQLEERLHAGGPVLQGEPRLHEMDQRGEGAVQPARRLLRRQGQGAKKLEQRARAGPRRRLDRADERLPDGDARAVTAVRCVVSIRPRILIAPADAGAIADER